MQLFATYARLPITLGVLAVCAVTVQAQELNPPLVPTPTPEDASINLDVRDYSDAEIKLLQELEAQRAKVERREQAVQLRERLVDLTEERIMERINTLEGLQQQLSGMLSNLSEKDEGELAKLAKIYESMKPATAAEIMNRLDNKIVYDLFRRMNDKKTAKIMEKMDIAKTRFISEMLAEELPLPELDDIAKPNS